MKKLIGLTVFLFALLFCFSSLAQQNRWHWIYSDENSGHYFDSYTLNYSYTPEKQLLVKAWVKVQHTEWHAQELVIKNNYNRQKYLHYSYDLWACEINVPEREMRFTALIQYDESGNILYADEISREWLVILPESEIEKYYYSIVGYLYNR